MVAIFADSNRASMRYIREDVNTWGVSPTSGKTRRMRFTGSTLNAQKNTVTSEEIRDDRMVSAIIEVGANSSGELNVEYSAGTHDDFLESFMYGAWTRPMTFDSAQGRSLQWADTDTLYVKGKDVTDYFEVGQRLRTQGFLTPANNDYFEIATISWNAGANRTEINMTAATAVAEQGSKYSRVYDAGDVMVLKNTSIRAGTAGANTFDSNGGNAFAAVIAAGHLVVGQKIFVEGLGLETGTVTFADVPAAGSRVSVSDGAKVLTFQFGGSYPQTVVPVELASDVASLAENLYDAVNDQRVKGNLEVSATFAAGVVTLKNLNVTGGALTEVLDSGNDITVVNFANGNASNRGIFTVTALTDDEITVDRFPGTNANGGSRPVTIKGSMLRNPYDPDEITPQSFTIETGFEDVDQFFIADGQRIGSFAMNVASQSILNGSFGLQGRAMTRQVSTKLGDAPFTPLDTTATQVLNATSNVGTITVLDEELTTAIQSIAINGNNNLRDQNAVSYKFPAGIGAGRMEITGTVVAYFANGDMWDRFIEHDEVSLSFPVTSIEGHTYVITVPSAHFSTDTVNPPGLNQDILENLEFMAKRDPETDCQIQIDRFSCTFPPTA